MRMTRRTNRTIGATSAWIIFGCGSVVIIGSVGTLTLARGAIGTAAGEATIEPVLLTGFKYLGNGKCGGADCHGAGQPKVHHGLNIGDELMIWQDTTADPHSGAFNNLGPDNTVSAGIAAKLKLAGSMKDAARCVSCHRTNVPPDQIGEGASIESFAVGCESCHGPGEKYKDLHDDQENDAESWTMTQRNAIGSAGLRTQFGMIDTRDIAVRARLCVACHLQIDKDLIDAGHPTLSFDLQRYDDYSRVRDGALRHWDSPKDQMIDARLWATGQAGSLEAAKAQVAEWKAKQWDTALADELVGIYQMGVDVAKVHFKSDTVEGLATAEYTAKACAAAAADLAGRAKATDTDGDAARAFALVDGVWALIQSACEASGATPDLAAYDAASQASGDEYLAAVKKLAATIAGGGG